MGELPLKTSKVSIGRTDRVTITIAPQLKHDAFRRAEEERVSLSDVVERALWRALRTPVRAKRKQPTP